MDGQPHPRQDFLTLETVSSHQPFYDPVSGRISTEGTFRYTDAALGRFLDRLQATGFLKDGLLIVTSDHRAMTPATAQERAHMGPRRLSRIPLLLDKGVPVGKEEQTLTRSQQDLPPSLATLLTGQAPCTPPWQACFPLAAQPLPPALHPAGHPSPTASLCNATAAIRRCAWTPSTRATSKVKKATPTICA